MGGGSVGLCFEEALGSHRRVLSIEVTWFVVLTDNSVSHCRGGIRGVRLKAGRSGRRLLQPRGGGWHSKVAM